MELQNAFAECPESLSLYQIRSLHAFDNIAADIKYHGSCWRDIIDKRVPEIQKSASSSKNLCKLSKRLVQVEFAHQEDNFMLDNSNESLNFPLEVSDMQLRDGSIITNNDTFEIKVPTTSLKEIIHSQIVNGAKMELLKGRSLTLQNLVEIYKTRIEEYGSIDERTDSSIRNEIRHVIEKRICHNMNGVELQNAFSRNESQRLITNDLKAYTQKLAEETYAGSHDAEVAILNKASAILRKKILFFIKENKNKIDNFRLSLNNVHEEYPPELFTFVESLLFGQRQLDTERSLEQKEVTDTVSSSILFHIKTNRQVKYKKKERSRHTYIPQQLMARTLAIRHCERNNSILHLLSAPYFGITLTPRTALLLETMIANSIVKIVQKEGVYIPPNMERGVRLSFHIDNFDEQVETFDGKNTVHYLLIVGFQRRHGDFKPMELKLEKNNTLTLNDNNFGEILPCNEPSNKSFKRTPGCEDASCSLDYEVNRSKSMFFWKLLRSFEHLLVLDESATYISEDIQVESANIMGTEHKEQWNINSLVLPSFGATNSLLVDMDMTLTNIFTLPFVAGPASSTSAVYTSLDIAYRTSNTIHSDKELEVSSEVEDVYAFKENIDPAVENSITRTLETPPAWKTVIVLDLDLYARAYKLVHSRSDLRDRYVLCLGELHIVFAEIRAIGTFINSSGLDDAWMDAEWFDSECLLRQVRECTNMKRALAAHEATLIAVNILILQEALVWYKEQNWCNNDLIESLTTARNAIRNKDLQSGAFREAWIQFQRYVTDIELEEKIKHFVLNNINNHVLQFLVKYSQMVTRLFTFIEATRSRKWVLHLDSFEDMIADFASMNRIKYRLYSAIYVADMRHLETNDPETWRYFMEGNFCCQKNEIPFTAIGRDHCGEQQNKVLKGRGGIAGLSSNLNSTNQYFMTAPILAQIYSDMQRKGGESEHSRRLHHQLCKSYTFRQNKWITSLLKSFERHKVSFSRTNSKGFYNVVTGQVFSDAIYQDLIAAYNTGQQLYKEFVEERLKPESKVGLFARLKKSKLKTCKEGNKGASIKYKDKVATLKEENLFISRIAMIRGSREVDMKSIIGNHELTPVVLSLMKQDGTLLDGWDGKAELAATTLKEANLPVVVNIPFQSEVVAIDAMFLMNQISTKPTWVKTGKDIAKEFCDRVEMQSEGAEIIVIGFEWYLENSLKSMAWKSRSSGDKKIRHNYVIESDTDLSKRCMADILGTIPTKRSLTTLLMNEAEQNLKERNVAYIIVGNGTIISSYSPERDTTNHTEGETAIIMALSLLDVEEKHVVVFGNDVDLFVLLLAHYQNINCAALYMKSLSGYTSISEVYNFLGPNVSSALLPFHAFTGCDISGKFSGRSKSFWTKKFLSERDNDDLIQALLSLHESQSVDIFNSLSSFVCRSYCPKRTPKKITDSLVETRYFLYRKFRSETSKLPPSPGAFVQHMERSCCPLIVWQSSHLRETRLPVHHERGWYKIDDVLMPICTTNEVAPEDLITLVSCQCNGNCSKNICTCKKNNEPCTDFCGCGDSCENTDIRPQENLGDEEDLEEEELEEDEDDEDESNYEDETDENET